MPCRFKRSLLAVKLLAVVVALPATVFAATNESSWLRLSWLSDDGLPNNTVGGLAQTPDGFLWLGTPNGLARFDGASFEDFPSTNFIGLPNRGILTMISSRDGGLWLGMDRAAIVGLKGGRSEVISPPRELAPLTINSLIEDGQHAIWVAYRGGAVCRIQNGRFQQFTEEEGLPGSVEICALAADAQGRLWFAKAGQLGVFRDGRFQALTQIEAATSRVTAAHDGGVWVCSGFRLFKYREGGQLADFGEFLPKRAGTEPSVMLQSRDGAVWIGTTFSGLFRFNGKSFESVPTTHQEILSLMEDAEGNIWVGTGGGGLNQVRPRAVHLESAEAGLPFEAIHSLAEDTNGVIWAAAQNGSLARRIEGRWVTFPTGENWASDAMVVCADPAGTVWVGTRFHRLLCWRGDRFVSWGDNQQIKGQTIHALLLSKAGDLWIGEDSPTAVQRLRNGKTENFELPTEIRVIRAAAEDAAGNIWFGTSKGILMRFDGERFVDETAATTGDPQPIRCLYATPDGSLWIGYAGWGLGRLKNGRFTTITSRQGLHDDFVSQIIEDGRGWLWFGANRGIFKVRQAELNAVADGKAERVRSIHYGAGAGLPGLQANFGSSPIALHSRDGRLWLPMRTALAVADVQRLRENFRPPPVLLNRVLVGERTVAAYGGVVAVPQSPGGETLDLARVSSGLRIPPDHRRLEFEFTALSFAGPENIAFRCRLEGFDDDWMNIEAGRSAVYSRLPVGKYQFQVNACNSEGVWNENAATLGFVVLPFFWQTWWFRGSVVAAFTAMIIAIVRYVSFRRLRAQLSLLEAQAALHKERARIAKDIHDDLGANLTQISIIGELAHQDRDAPDKVTVHVEKISGAARQAVKSLDEIVWAVNPRNDTLAHFIDYTGQFAVDYLRLANIRCRLDLPEQVPLRELSTDVRHNLFLVVKEAINNTVKHARATELRLRIAVTDAKLEISLEDNGCGFNQPQETAGGDGLQNMRQRLAEIGGQCWIQGRPGAGAKVTIEFPWPPDRT